MFRTSISFAIAASCCLPAALARDYYVAPTGSDANPGTLAQPFQTVQKAATIMAAGDAAYIRAGVYRETVTPAHSGTQAAPIVFQPYNNESVTVSGADVIPAASWALSSGNIYKAKMSWDLGAGNNQIFLDGQMMTEARWPNTTLDVSHPTLAHISGGSFVAGSPLSTGTITDPNLPSRAAAYWNGADIHILLGAGWGWQTGTIVDSSTTHQLSFTWTQGTQTPSKNNPYYLSGKLGELDAAGEWFLDSSASTLYFWTPGGDNPHSHTVEAKHRQFAFDLSARSFITLQGLNLFAASINSSSTSQYLLLDALNFTYVSHYSLMPGKGVGGGGTSNTGIVLSGTNGVLRNSTIAFSAGNGVMVNGAGQRVFNNTIRDCDYAGTYASPITAGNTGGTDIILAYNTIYNSARFGIWHPANFSAGRILHNEIYDIGLATSDLGCTYSYGTDGGGTEIAYNLCHDVKGSPLGDGIYLDNGDSNFVVHHNVVWNAPTFPMMLNSPSTNNKVYNNTFVGGGKAGFSVYSQSGPSQLPGTVVENNIFTAAIPAAPEAVVTNNILAGADPQFVNAAANDYQLQPTSPAIGAGLVIPPYTDGYTGRAPDIGAYDHGLPPFKAGAKQPTATAASAASYIQALAPEAIAVAFGPKLGTGTATAPSVPLPTTLAGTTVMVTDGAGIDRPAPLFYVLPTQVSFEIPPGTAPGIALIAVTGGDGTVSLGSTAIFAVAPALFSADASGAGIAAAGVVTAHADGSQSYTTAAVFDATQNKFVAAPIDLSTASDQVALVLYGTGIRGSSLSAVKVTVGGVNCQVTYAGAQNVFPGLDQVNVLLPHTLAGSGSVAVALTASGQAANLVTVDIR